MVRVVPALELPIGAKDVPFCSGIAEEKQQQKHLKYDLWNSRRNFPVTKYYFKVYVLIFFCILIAWHTVNICRLNFVIIII